MIFIKKITYKNFLSYGNAPTTITLNTHKATLIRGKNGHGKSVWLDLVLYALYGKPYRDINKNQLINSINGGSLLVDIEFSINGVEYQIVRGQKPQVFDIFRNGELIEQNAATRDYQAFLESNILKVSEKTFKQIAVLGSASYIPFMQLSASQRRELVESILDIEVFSKMNTVLKERIASTKEELTTIGHKLDIKKAEAIAQQKLIKVMQENTKARVDEYETKRAGLLLELAKWGMSVNDLQQELDQMNGAEPEFDQAKYDIVTANISNATRDIKAFKKKLTTIEHIESCPTCLQEVSKAHIKNVGTDINGTIASLEATLRLWEEDLVILNHAKDALYAHLADYNDTSKLLTDHMREQNAIQTQIADIDETIKNILSNTDDISTEEAKLKSLGEAAMKMIERKNTLSEEKHLQDVAAQLLKDTGIKTAVVREYLPVLNQLINKYLAMFDFFVDFSLDESFTEVIKSRGRDIFSYSSFSEGEKRRIDFAILMSFRQLAALKNSAKTNVLIFDEIVDGAFDLEARQQFNDLLSNIPNSNVIVISHASADTEAYDRVIHVEKKGDFSVYDIVE